jgi:hypothetical protein
VATATPTRLPRERVAAATNPLALWHLLSLDAPTVAALWTWFIASVNHIHLPFSSILAMALAVWILYAADRLMDARLDAGPTRHEDLEARHYFHYRHRNAFLAGILLAAIALALLLPHLDPTAIHLYLILGGFVSGYFILIHATRSATAQQKVAHRLPKEIAVGLCFAAATFIPTVARNPGLRSPLLPSALLFATLCSLNCLFIYAWEHDNRPTKQSIHAITRHALKNLPSLTILLILASLALILFDHRTPQTIPGAIAIAAALLLLLKTQRHSIARTTLRACADLALATPLLLLPLLYQ